MYSRRSKETGIEPCWTPCLTKPYPETIVLKYVLYNGTLWYLSFRLDFIKALTLLAIPVSIIIYRD